MSTLEFGIKITADGRVFVSEAGRVTQALNSIGASSDRVNERVSRATSSIAAMGHAGAAIYGLQQAFQALTGAMRVIDEFTTVNSRLSLVTSSTRQLASVQGQLFRIAQESRVGYSALAETYARTATATRELGIPHERLLNVTRSLSQAMAIGGGSAESMRAALIQLSQGLASGTLRGEELNSVMEQAPRLAQAIAEGMGKSVGELRKMGEAGQITARQIVEAIEKAAPGLEAEFARVGRTVGSSFQVLRDAVGNLLSEFDKGTGTSKALADVIDGLARSIGEASKQAKGFGEAVKPFLDVAVWTAGGVAAAVFFAKAHEWLKKLAVLAAGIRGGIPGTVAGLAIGIGAEAYQAYAGSESGLERALASKRSELALRQRSMREVETWPVSEKQSLALSRNRADEARILKEIVALEEQLALVRAKPISPEQQKFGEFRRSEIELINEQAAAQRGVEARLRETGAAYAAAAKGVQTATSFEREYQAALTATRAANANRVEAMRAAGASAEAIGRANAEQLEVERALTKERDKGLSSLRQRSQYEATLIDMHKEANEESEQRANAEEKLNEVIRQGAIEAAKATATEAERLLKQQEAIAQYERETDALGETKDEVAELAIKRLEERAALLRVMEGTEAYVKLIDDEIAAIRRRRQVESGVEARDAARKGTEAAHKEWQQAADMIERSLTDALLRGFESGKDFAKNFVDTLKNMFSTLVLRPIIQAIVSPAAGAITGALGLGAPGTASAAGGALGGFNPLNLLGGGGGGGSSLLGFGGIGGLLSGSGGIFGAGAIGNSFAMGGAGQALGLSAFGLDAAGGLALTGLGTTLGTIIPVVGAGLAIAAMFGAFSKKGGGAKSGGFASSGADVGRYFTPSDADANVKSIVDATSGSYTQLLRQLGGTGTAGFAIGFDTDPKGKASNRVEAGAYVGGQQVYRSLLQDLGRDQAALEAALKTESKRAVLAALQASDLPEAIGAILRTLDAASASDEAIDTLLSLATAIGGDALREAQKAVADAQRSSVEVLRDMGSEVRRLAADMDGSTASMQALTAATGTYRQAVAQALIAIEQIGASLRTMFAGTREQLEFGGLGKQETYDLYQAKGQTLLERIAETDDPAVVQQYAERINDYFLKAFNLLSPEEMLAEKPRFMESLNQLDTAVAGKLDDIATTIGGEAGDTFTVVRDALADAATKMGQAADKQLDAMGRLDGIVGRFEESVGQIAGSRIEVVTTGSGAVGGLG